jgi:hypothetical protein
VSIERGGGVKARGHERTNLRGPSLSGSTALLIL